MRPRADWAAIRLGLERERQEQRDAARPRGKSTRRRALPARQSGAGHARPQAKRGRS